MNGVVESSLYLESQKELGGYSWTKIGEINGYPLYLCDQIVKKMAFNKSDMAISWRDSDIRKWLNSDFYNSLSPEEQSMIVPTGGSRLFLLSEEEYKKFEENIPKADNWWWLRTPYKLGFVKVALLNGSYIHSSYAHDNHIGVRPAALLKD